MKDNAAPGFGAPFVAALRAESPLAVVAHLAGGLVALGISFHDA